MTTPTDKLVEDMERLACVLRGKRMLDHAGTAIKAAAALVAAEDEIGRLRETIQTALRNIGDDDQMTLILSLALQTPQETE